MKKIIAVLSAAAMLLSLAACGTDTGNETADTAASETESITEAVTENGETTEPEAQSEEASAQETEETASDTSETSADAETGKTTSATTVKAVKTAEMSKAEIVNLYNTSANKIKTTAKTITRNYQKMKNIPEKLELPSAIQSLGEWAIEKFVKGSDEAAVFDEQEEIMEYFPVQNETYTSHLTEDMVKSATVKDDGKNYVITIVLYDDKITSPAKGEGYAGVFNTVTASTFEDINVPGTTFEKVNVHGLDGKIVATMNKETKQITHLTPYSTDYLDLTVKVAGSHLNAKMAFSNENDYTIKY